MDLEVLISTMGQRNFELVDNMRISGHCLIVNQCSVNGYQEDIHDGRCVRMLSSISKGLSTSRNIAIKNSNCDVCLLADDDMIYREDYQEIVLDAYRRHPEASVIVFDVSLIKGKEKVKKTLRTSRVGWRDIFRICSVQISFRRSKIIEHGIKFDEQFGSGSTYSSGEENIFLRDVLKSGLTIVYVQKEIALVRQGNSTWFNGYNESYMKSKGALFRRLSANLWLLLCLVFATKKISIYRNYMSWGKAMYCLIKGGVDYKRQRNIQKTENLYF